jgi:hypothetical protein
MTIGQLGTISSSIDYKRLKKWKSGLFQVNGAVGKYRLPAKAEGMFWQYTDDQMGKAAPAKFDGDILVLVTNVPLEANFYMRRLTGNRVCISLYGIDDILSYHNIPIETFLLTKLYEVAIVYLAVKASGDRLPTSEVQITHDDTRGCIFDMTGDKTEIAVSCRAPKVCDECLYKYHRQKVSMDDLELANRELKSIRQSVYHRISRYIKKHPILAITATALVTIGLNLISNNLISWISSLLNLA